MFIFLIIHFIYIYPSVPFFQNFVKIIVPIILIGCCAYNLEVFYTPNLFIGFKRKWLAKRREIIMLEVMLKNMKTISIFVILLKKYVINWVMICN